MAHPRIILLDAVTTAVTNGPFIGLQGTAMALGNTVNVNLMHQPVEIFTKVTGTPGDTATVVIQTSPDASSWTTWLSRSYTVPASGSTSYNNVGALKTKYIRSSVSAISGATVNSYLSVGASAP